MKKVNKIIISILFAGVIFGYSCKDKLDLVPYDSLTPEQLYSTPKGFEDGVKGVYAALMYGSYAGGGIFITPEILSDNVTYNPKGRGTYRDLFNYSVNSGNEQVGMYGVPYILISRANLLLSNITEENSTDFVKNIKGEALALRAMAHFDMAKFYCKIPTQDADANNSLGIFYAKEYKPAEKVRRVGTTVKSVYDNIVADLVEAESLIAKDNGVGRLNKAAVNAILSRVYLYMGEYDKVIEVADKITLTVASLEDFPKVWLDEYEKNVLFKVKIDDKDKVQIGVKYSQTTVKEDKTEETKSEYVCSYELYKLYLDKDIRKKAYIKTGKVEDKEYNHVAKYLGRAKGNKNVVDGKYIRAEEVLLNKAEALYKKGEEAKALVELDKLRVNRYEGFTGGSEVGAGIETAIQEERRLELAFEGDRFFQLKRLGKNMKRTTDGELSDGSGTPPIVTLYEAGGFRWQQPIPQGAFDSNSDLTSEDQNPGY